MSFLVKRGPKRSPAFCSVLLRRTLFLWQPIFRARRRCRFATRRLNPILEMRRSFGLRCLVEPTDLLPKSVREWIESVGQVRSLRFYVTQIELRPGDRTSVRVRYEIASQHEALHYRVGQWQQVWMNDRLSRFEPLEETLATTNKPLFADVTQEFLGNVDSFQRQLATRCPVLAGPPGLGERH